MACGTSRTSRVGMPSSVQPQPQALWGLELASGTGISWASAGCWSAGSWVMIPPVAAVLVVLIGMWLCCNSRVAWLGNRLCCGSWGGAVRGVLRVVECCAIVCCAHERVGLARPPMVRQSVLQTPSIPHLTLQIVNHTERLAPAPAPGPPPAGGPRALILEALRGASTPQSVRDLAAAIDVHANTVRTALA